jgi:hypothetical protein
VAGPRQSGQPQPRDRADIRAIPLRLRKCGQRAGGEGALQNLRRAWVGRAFVPGGRGQPQSLDGGESRYQEPSAWAAADHLINVALAKVRC